MLFNWTDRLGELTSKVKAVFALHSAISELSLQLPSLKEDLLMVLTHFRERSLGEQHEGFMEQCVQEVFRLFNLTEKLEQPQIDRLIRSQPFWLGTSLQYSCGYQGERQNRSLSSKIAWSVLSLRTISHAFGFAMQNKPTPSASGGVDLDINKPGMLSPGMGLKLMLIRLRNLAVHDHAGGMDDCLHRLCCGSTL